MTRIKSIAGIALIPLLIMAGVGRLSIWFWDTFTISPHSSWISQSWWGFQFPGLILSISCFCGAGMILIPFLIKNPFRQMKAEFQNWRRWWVLPMGLYLIYCWGVGCWQMLYTLDRMVMRDLVSLVTLLPLGGAVIVLGTLIGKAILWFRESYGFR